MLKHTGKHFVFRSPVYLVYTAVHKSETNQSIAREIILKTTPFVLLNEAYAYTGSCSVL